MPFYIVFLVLAGIALLAFAYGLFSTPLKRTKTAEPERGTPGEGGVCPVCGTRLGTGEQIKSALFPGKTDRLCHIFGCPHCHPYKEASLKRTCPVCKKTVPPEGYLIARLFDRPQNKRHVHIIGCTICKFSKKT